MKEEDFIQKYGKEEVTFVECYKYRMIYKNEKVTVSGLMDYRDSLSLKETVNDVFQLDYFHFSII